MKATLRDLPFIRTQRGAALVMGLLVLVVLLLLGITATTSTILQERMAGNFRDAGLAFEASEAGNRWAAAWLQSRPSTGRPFPCSENCRVPSPDQPVVWASGPAIDDSEELPGDDDNPSKWDYARDYGIDPATDLAVSPAMALPMVIQQPKFLMEEIHFARDDLAGEFNFGVAYFRVTSLGIGARASSAEIIKTVVAKRFE
jgi:type IV pilus assembly protein PilX